MDFSKAGILEGIWKGIKVFGYVAASGAITGIIAYLQNISVTQTDVTIVALIALVNAILVAVEKWLNTPA